MGRDFEILRAHQKQIKMEAGYDPMPYVARMLRDRILVEEEALLFFEKNSVSEDPYVKMQAAGNIPSNRSRVLELKAALEFLRTYKKPGR